MTKYRLNHTLLFVLISAFLTMQSASAHIHLAEHHDHDGSHHQHQSEAHAHQSIDIQDNAVEFSHQIDHANVVELDHKCSTVKKYQQKQSCVTTTSPTFWQTNFFKPVSIELPVIVNTKLSHLYRSTVYLRAPPQLS